MSLRRPRRLQLQQLEERTTPAVSTRFVGGLLIIRSDNLSNTLTISEVGTTGQFAVTNKVGLGPTKAVGTFKLSSLSVTMGNGNDVVDLRVNKSLPGNVTVSLGNGSDVFTTKNATGPLPTPLARIGGNLFVNTGKAGKLGVLGGQYDEAVELYNLRFQGRSTTVVGSAGSAAELLDINNATIAGSLSVTNVYQTGLGTFLNLTSPVSVGGNISVSNAKKNTDARADAFVGPGNDLFFFNNVTVGGNVTYVGGSGQDTVELPGDVTTTTPAVINGSVYFSAGEGVSTLSLGTGGTPGAAAQVGGNVTYLGGSSADRFFLDTDANVNGNVYVNVGEGDNQLFGNSLPGFFGTFDPIFSATVGGDLTILAGNGNNYLASFGDGAGTLTVNGNLLIQLGNGDTLGSPAGAPSATVTFFNDALSVGGTATYRAGTGTNNLDITNETIGDLRLIFSGGPTDVQFNQGSGFFNGNLFLDFGVGFGPKNLGGTAAFGGPVTILNY